MYFRHANNLAPGQFTTHYKAKAMRVCRQWLESWRYRLRMFPASLFMPAGSIALRAGRDLTGFHLPETFQDRPFRWSEPRAGVRIRLPRDRKFKIELDLGPLRAWKGDLHGHLRFAIDGREIGPSNIKSKNGVLHIRLPRFDGPAMSGTKVPFTWECEPLPSEGDGRALGLPVFAIRIRRIKPGKSPPPTAG